MPIIDAFNAAKLATVTKEKYTDLKSNQHYMKHQIVIDEIFEKINASLGKQQFEISIPSFESVMDYGYESRTMDSYSILSELSFLNKKRPDNIQIKDSLDNMRLVYTQSVISSAEEILSFLHFRGYKTRLESELTKTNGFERPTFTLHISWAHASE